MNRNLVLQCDNSEDSPFKLLDPAPEPISISLLRFASQRFFQNSNAPFFPQIGTFPQDFLLKIFREFVFWHLQRITRFFSDGQPNGVAAQPLTRVETIYHRNFAVGSSGRLGITLHAVIQWSKMKIPHWRVSRIAVSEWVNVQPLDNYRIRIEHFV